jgi:hypothetical protein
MRTLLLEIILILWHGSNTVGTVFERCRIAVCAGKPSSLRAELECYALRVARVEREDAASH